MRFLHSCGLAIGSIIISTAPLWGQTTWSSYAGNPLISGGALDPSVIFDSTAQRYSIWYVTPSGVVRQGTSSDGLAWTISPTVALNSGPPGSYDQLITSVSVVKNGGSYFMYYSAYGPSDTSTIGLAISADGVHWQKHPSSPVLKPGAMGTWEFPKVTGARVVVVNGSFYMMYSGYNGAFQDAGLATSSDGITWVKSPMNPLLVHGSSSSVDARFVGAAGIAFNDSIFCLIYRATNSSGSQSYCLATSPNGTQWKKFTGNPVYVPAPYGWDSNQIGGGTLLPVSGGFKFWWCGTNVGSWGIGFASIKFSGLIEVEPQALDFGPVRTGSTDTLSLLVSNLGLKDTLNVSSVTSNNLLFGGSAVPLSLPPGTSGKLAVWYAPSTTGRDSGTISIASNDPGAPITRCRVTGRGFALTVKPVIDTLGVVPNTYYQIRVNWIRSLLDTAGAADQVVQYSIWRLVPGAGTAGTASRAPSDILPSSNLIGPMWEYIQTVPAMGFDRYSTTIPAHVDYTVRFTANVIMVAAHTKNLGVSMSDPDTILVDPPPLTGVHESGNTRGAATYSLDQNFPNPFNPTTTIRYSLPRASAVTLSVFNMLGERVATVVDTHQDAGDYAVRFDGSGLASGVYLYRLRAEGFVQSRRLLLLK